MQKQAQKIEGERGKENDKEYVVSFKRRYMKSKPKDWAIQYDLAIIAALHGSWLFYYIP